MPTLTDEQHRLQKLARRIAEDEIAPLADEMERTGLPSSALSELYRERGWLASFAPVAYGGAGISTADWCLLNEEVARVSVAAAMAMEFGPVAAVRLAPPEQHARLFPFVVGRVGAFASTEPEAGSDLMAIRTQVAENGDRYVLNGHKCLINNGGVAEVLAVVATAQPGSGWDGIRVLLVDAAAPGIRRSAEKEKMGLRGASLVDLTFDNVDVPATHLLAGHDGADVLQRIFTLGRIIIAAQAIGNATAAMEYALRHSLRRKQFGQPVYHNQAVSFMIANMAISIEAARELTCRAAKSLDDDEAEASALASMAKVFATDTGMTVTADAVQCLGGAGYLRENSVERMMRDAKALQIVVGTNEIQRVVISRHLATTATGAGLEAGGVARPQAGDRVPPSPPR
jgi:alkylation response protein AidB-like acyl-CoA dehydrogenase